MKIEINKIDKSFKGTSKERPLIKDIKKIMLEKHNKDVHNIDYGYSYKEKHWYFNGRIISK